MFDRFLDGLRYSLRNERPILRRYLILGAFDGVLVSLGILVSSSFAGASDKVITISIVTALVAVAISSAWNSLIVELKERRLEFARLEKQMMKSLRGSIYDYGMRMTVVLSVLAHGVSPFLGLLSLLAFHLTGNTVYSAAISLVELLGLGFAYEGNTSDKIRSGLFIALGGVMTLVISVLLAR
ncbi:MAG: hypothetical protein RXS23_05060 [Metallosphaera yellowstonensis]